MMKSYRFYLLTAINAFGFMAMPCGVLSTVQATPKSLTLAWDANTEPDIAGYKVHYGVTSGCYTQITDVGNVTTANVQNLASGNTYFFAVTAYNSAGLESLPSNEISSVAVNRPPTVNLAAVGNRIGFLAPASISVNASASDSDGSVIRVEFYNAGEKLGEVLAPPYTFAWQNVPAGTYSLTARAYDDEGASTTSATVNISVVTPPPATLSAIQYLADGSTQFTVTSMAGQTIGLYTSSDMVNWTQLTSSVSTTGTCILNDPASASLDSRFYRLADSTADAVGFMTLRIAGIPYNQLSMFSYIGISLMNPVSYTGNITATGSRSLTDSQAAWTDNQFNGTNGDYFLEIASGPSAGVMTDIVSTDATTKTLTTDEDLSSLLTGGELYKIRKHRTIADVFGANNEAGLNGASSVSSADEIRILNPGTQRFATYYFKTGGFGGIGWRSTTDSLANASRTKLYADQGIVICRKVAGDLRVRLNGVVKSGPSMVPISANINLVGNVYASGNLTLGNSYLYVGDDTLGLAGASSISSADEVRIFDGKAFQKYFYKTGGFGGFGWRNGTDSLVDMSNTTLPAGAAIYIVRKNGRSGFNWIIPQPF